MVFQRKTVDGVLSSFNKILKDLAAINEQCNNDINDAEIAIKEATDKRTDAQLEKARASNVASKLTALIS